MVKSHENRGVCQKADARFARVNRKRVIYGHHMKSGVMFGNLDKYAVADYCKEHPAVLFQTADGVSSYRVVAVLKADVSMFPFMKSLDK